MGDAITTMLNVVLNVTDAFNTNKIAISTDTDVLKTSNVRRYDGPVIYPGAIVPDGWHRAASAPSAKACSAG
ncbi:hypothetical protein [Massilia eurypsychrophila]|uniref:hypothetical protein n=1 Tax=Massilia eurypsychrophila TaxID=1485217 RepID=UPI0010340B06|nr:hypothetical protein [Massilia eurypsychrophila]